MGGVELRDPLGGLEDHRVALDQPALVAQPTAVVALTRQPLRGGTRALQLRVDPIDHRLLVSDLALHQLLSHASFSSAPGRPSATHPSRMAVEAASLQLYKGPGTSRAFLRGADGPPNASTGCRAGRAGDLTAHGQTWAGLLDTKVTHPRPPERVSRCPHEPGQAPLKVNRSTKVNRLSADLVDGSHTSDLRTTAYHYALPAAAGLSSTTRFTLPGLPGGEYAASYAVSGNHSAVPSFFGCWFEGSGDIIGVTLTDYDGSTCYLSRSTYIDTTADPHDFRCQASAGTYGIDQSIYPSDLLLTRLDTVTSGAPAASRAGGTGARPGQ